MTYLCHRGFFHLLFALVSVDECGEVLENNPRRLMPIDSFLAEPIMKYQIHSDSLDSAKLERESQQLLARLKTDPQLRKEAAAAGIDLSAFDSQVAPRADEALIRVEAESAGVAPGVIEIIIIFATPLAPVVADIVRDCWTQLILPRLKKKYGQDAIEEAPDK